MKYNSSRNKLRLPEYGRNIQKLVEQAVMIENKDEKAKFVQGIINLMGKMYPYLRDLRDFKHKLWDHLVIMSDFKLGKDSHYEAPTADAYSKAPFKIPYSSKRIKFRHYGKVITLMIDYAVKIEDIDRKNALIGLVANHMKKQYLRWNKNIIDDSIIFNDIGIISNNELKIPHGLVLTDSRDLIHKHRKKRVKKSR